MTSELRIAGAGLSADAIARVAQVARLGTLGDVLQVIFAQRPAWELVEVIVQDEFTHDVIVAGPQAAYLVFDTT